MIQTSSMRTSRASHVAINPLVPNKYNKRFEGKPTHLRKEQISVVLSNLMSDIWEVENSHMDDLLSWKKSFSRLYVPHVRSAATYNHKRNYNHNHSQNHR